MTWDKWCMLLFVAPSIFAAVVIGAQECKENTPCVVSWSKVPVILYDKNGEPLKFQADKLSQEQHPCVVREDGTVVYVGKNPGSEACYVYQDIDGPKVTTAPGKRRISAAEWTENRDGQFVERSSSVVRKFKEFTGFTNGRRGYVIDHIIPLCAGGRDSIENMQWQEEALSYRKDVFERALCRALVQQKMRVQ